MTHGIWKALTQTLGSGILSHKRLAVLWIPRRSLAHNGKLSFRLGHSEYMSNGKDMIKDWDVILESKEWRLRVGVKNLIPPWVGATNNELSLNEKSWTVMKGAGHGHSPTEIQMLRLLSSLSAMYFRGGYYDGHEETWIDSVLVTEGDHHAETLLRKVKLPIFIDFPGSSFHSKV